jgi:hypothetical protein
MISLIEGVKEKEEFLIELKMTSRKKRSNPFLRLLLFKIYVILID